MKKVSDDFVVIGNTGGYYDESGKFIVCEEYSDFYCDACQDSDCETCSQIALNKSLSRSSIGNLDKGLDFSEN